MSVLPVIAEGKMREILKLLVGYSDLPLKKISKNFKEKYAAFKLNACCGLSMLIDSNVRLF